MSKRWADGSDHVSMGKTNAERLVNGILKLLGKMPRPSFCSLGLNQTTEALFLPAPHPGIRELAVVSLWRTRPRTAALLPLAAAGARTKPMTLQIMPKVTLLPSVVLVASKSTCEKHQLFFT